MASPESAKAELTALFTDTSRSKEETLEILAALQRDIEGMIAVLSAATLDPESPDTDTGT